MAERIIVTTEEMQATISKYNEARNIMDEARQAMQSALDHLCNCWSSPGQASMMEKWTLINANIKNSDMAIGRSVQALTKTIESFNQGEEDVITKAEGLDEGKELIAFEESSFV